MNMTAYSAIFRQF